MNPFEQAIEDIAQKAYRKHRTFPPIPKDETKNTLGDNPELRKVFDELLQK